MHSVQEKIAEFSRRIGGVEICPHALIDRRADGGRRDIAIMHRHVLISRRLHGIDMRIKVPSRDYFGVVLSIFSGTDGLPFYRISMPHTDPDLAMVLFEARDDREIVAVWNAWSRHFALPKLLERDAGPLESGESWIGATAMGNRPRWRRRGGALAKRKPKLLNRRRNAHAVIAVAGLNANVSAMPAASFPPL